MRSTLKTSLYVLLLLPCFPVLQSSGAVSPLQVTGARLTDAGGRAVSLYGMSFGWSCFHPRFIQGRSEMVERRLESECSESSHGHRT